MDTLLSFSKPAIDSGLIGSEYALLLFGIILVVGLVGEYATSEKWKKHVKVFEMLVIIGVAGELFADGGIFLFSRALQIKSDNEIREANAHALDAKNSAGLAAEAAARAQESVTAVEKQADALDIRLGAASGKLGKLEGRLAWRRVSPSQYASLSKILRPFANTANTKVIVFVFDNEDIEAKTFAGDLVHLLHDGAGWSPWLNNKSTSSSLPAGLTCQLDLSIAAGKALAKVCAAYTDAQVTSAKISGWVGTIRVGLRPPP
jgi:hypothetical protein